MSKKQVLSEDLICHGSSELSMHNFLSSLGTWLGVKNAMPWKEKKLLVQDYWERLSQALLHSLRPEQKKSSIFQLYLKCVLQTRHDCFLSKIIKSRHNFHPTLLWERETLAELTVCYLHAKNSPNSIKKDQKAP